MAAASWRAGWPEATLDAQPRPTRGHQLCLSFSFFEGEPMDVHEEAIDDLIGEGLVVIDGRNEKVSYWLTVSPEAGPVVAEGSISGPERLMRRVRKAKRVKLALGDGPVVTLECQGGSGDVQWVKALISENHKTNVGSRRTSRLPRATPPVRIVCAWIG
jgi:hypothetical protein